MCVPAFEAPLMKIIDFWLGGVLIRIISMTTSEVN